MAICWTKNYSGRLVTLCMATFMLAACDMHAESAISDRRLQVREEQFTEEMPVKNLDENYIAGVAQDYGQSGRGPINLTITFDPVSKYNTAMRASDEAVRVSKAFRKEGVSQVVTSILPVREQGDQSVAILSYLSYQAAAPENCGVMTGLDSPILEHDPDYKLGCSVETVFAKQIADPTDLLGDSKPTAYTDGRPAANKIDAYRVGAPNQPLGGQSATD